MGRVNTAQRSVQFVRSTPGVGVALAGMKSVDHMREILAAANTPPAPIESILKLLRKAG